MQNSLIDCGSCFHILGLTQANDQLPYVPVLYQETDRLRNLRKTKGRFINSYSRDNQGPDHEVLY